MGGLVGESLPGGPGGNGIPPDKKGSGAGPPPEKGVDIVRENSVL